ncbi:MAG: hypothetical protein JXN64_07885 [Spirochaetes bacterium]|nr:hypothetical protein [Spirochaetota bacterium]
MKRKAIPLMSSVFKIIITLPILLIVAESSGMQTLSEEEFQNNFIEIYEWVQKQEILESFPYQIPYKLSDAGPAESKGLKLQLFKSPNAGNINAVYRRRSISGIVSDMMSQKIISNLNSVTDINLRLIRKKDNWISYFFNEKGGTTIDNKGETAGEPYNSKSNHTVTRSFSSDIRINNGNMLVKNSNYYDKSVMAGEADGTELRGGMNSKKNINPMLIRDVDTDKIIALGDWFTLILPEKKVKIGDQWEKEVYFEYGAEVSAGSGKIDTLNYILELLTYELKGFANVHGRRCAIIEFIKESYMMGDVQGVRNVADIKKIAKTLSKIRLKDMKDYMSSRSYQGESIFKELGVTSQVGVKGMGFIAFDYKMGIVVELHLGEKHIAGAAVKDDFGTLSTKQAYKVQHVFTISK